MASGSTQGSVNASRQGAASADVDVRDLYGIMLKSLRKLLLIQWGLLLQAVKWVVFALPDTWS